MATSEQDLLEDLADLESEGSADLGDEDDFGYFSEDPMSEDEFGAGADALDFDPFGGEDYAAEEAEEVTSQMLGGMLGAEDEDEFLGKLFSGAKNLIKKAAPIVGKIARGAGPLLSMIPHPAAQVAGQVAGVLGKLKAEGASVEDALEAVAEIAVRDRRALPVVAGLAARSVIKNRGAAMSPGQRQQVAKTMTKAATNLVASGGPKAIRALPKITKSVNRAAASKGMPTSVRPKAVARAVNNVAANPALMRKLSTPSPRGQALAARVANGGMRSINVPGPASITINVG
jgi:hypothetical protein